MQWSFSALAAPHLHINHFWSHLRSTISPTCKNVGFSQKLTTEELTQCDSTPSPTTLSVWSHTYFMQKRSYYSAPFCDAFCPLWLQIHLLYFQGLPFLGLAYSSYFCLNPLLSREKKKVKVLVTQSCPTLCDPMDCSPPGNNAGVNSNSFLQQISPWTQIKWWWWHSTIFLPRTTLIFSSTHLFHQESRAKLFLPPPQSLYYLQGTYHMKIVALANLIY